MENNQEILCPKCGSNQLTTSQKGLSAGKAVGGALLFGGVGVLAGLHGSKNIEITCLACGKKFNPGEGKIVTNNIDENPIDKRIVEIVKESGILPAIKFCKEAKNIDLSTAKRYVESIVKSENIVPNKKEGCFIATACYGDYNSSEVLVLRKYRDEVLSNTKIGRLFIKTYYFISPNIANLIAKSDILRNIVRKYFLSSIVNRLKK